MNTRVKELRKNLKLTQESFGRSIKLSKFTISNIENGSINITDRNIKEICETYNVNESWLRTGEGEMFAELSGDDELSMLIGEFLAENDDFKKKVIKTMLSLPNEDWYLIKKLIKTFKD